MKMSERKSATHLLPDDDKPSLRRLEVAIETKAPQEEEE